MAAVLCPVCQQALSSGECSRCGFDESCQYERFPTLIDLPEAQRRSLSSLRAAWLTSSTPEAEDPAVLFQRALQAKTESQQLELLSRASFLGHAPAQACLGEKYLDQNKPELAVTLFRKAAQQGNANACYQLSRCYRDGVGVQRSPQLALSWLTQASSRGHILAGTELADKLLTGKELPRDLNRAEALYRRAAQAGSPEGLVHLAKCFRDGTNVPRSPEKAAELLKEAGKHGSREASMLLSESNEKKSPPKPSSAPAGTSAPKAAAAGTSAPKTTAAGASAPKTAAGNAAAAKKPESRADTRSYAQGRAYDPNRYTAPKAAAEPARAAAKKPESQADSRSYAQGRAYDPNRYTAPKTSPAPKTAAAPKTSGTGAKAAGAAPSPQPQTAPQSPTSKLESKSLRQLGLRRVLDVFLIIYMAAACIGILSVLSAQSLPALILAGVFLWLSIRRYRNVTKVYKAKKAQSPNPKP